MPNRAFIISGTELKNCFMESTFRSPGGRIAAVAAGLLLAAAALAAGQGGRPGSQGAPVKLSAAQGVQVDTVPVKTELFLRLKTPVSTTSSHLNEAVEAEVERAVEINGEIAIPVGAILSGRIATLIPSSNPNDRAVILLEFNSLSLPGQSAIPVACRVSDVDNAREKVLPDGTIQGLLPSELPVTLLNSAIGKMQKRTGGAQSTQQSAGTWFGNPDTSINYPAGTEFSVVLDKPLEATGHFEPEFARQIPATLKDSVMQLLAQAPRRVKSKKGNPGGPT